MYFIYFLTHLVVVAVCDYSAAYTFCAASVAEHLLLLLLLFMSHIDKQNVYETTCVHPHACMYVLYMCTTHARSRAHNRATHAAPASATHNKHTYRRISICITTTTTKR